MAYGDGFAPLAPESDSLFPLPDDHRHGLIAVAVFGIMSFVSCFTLFFYLTYKLVRWHFKRPEQLEDRHAPHDLSLGLAQRQFPQTRPAAAAANADRLPGQVRSKKAPNQFLVLIYNLLFADMHQALAFLLNVFWAGSNGIDVGSSTCWAQGWFVSVGDLASSAFISSIAVHTYLAVVKGYKPPQWALYVAIACVWVFVYALAIIGVLITENGKPVGGLYVRAAAWCWMNVKYDSLRLWLHYFWIFLSLALTSLLYTMIFLSLRRERQASRPGAHSRTSSSVKGKTPPAPRPQTGHHPAFLIYPVIYVICTAPLALGRILTMSGRYVSVSYFCLAGAMIASNGWMDVLLFSTTRHSIIFNSDPDIEDSGLDTFTFMRTPHGRRFGNMVWVQGAVRSGSSQGAAETRRKGSGWWKLGGQPQHRSRGGPTGWPGGPDGLSQESLRGTCMDNGIQMDTVTTVVVEIDPKRKEPTNSVDGSEKGYDSSTAQSLRKYRQHRP